MSSTADLEFLLQVLQQLENLCLDGHVQGGGRFVGNQQLRRTGERHGDHDALALATGQHVREGIKALVRLDYAGSVQ